LYWLLMNCLKEQWDQQRGMNWLQKLVCNVSLRLLSYIHIWTMIPKISIVTLMNKGTFHQDVKEVENSYWGRWSNTMVADYCWALKREINDVTQKKNSWSQIICWILINVHLTINILHKLPFYLCICVIEI
jgi:hypothetical protein